MRLAGSAVQTPVVTGTSRTYRCSNASSSSRECPARPYPASATIRPGSTWPSTATLRTSSAAIRGSVRKVTSSGTWALARRSLARRLAPGLGQEQLVVQQARPGGGHPDQEDADLAVVLLAGPAVVLAGHTGGVRPPLGEDALVDHADQHDRGAGGGGASSSVKRAWASACTSP